MGKLLLSLLPLAIAASAISGPAIEFGASGPLEMGNSYSAEGDQVYLNAYKNPNASQSVTFQAPGTAADSWTWHVSVAEINIPSSMTQLGSPSANYSEQIRLTNTQWHLDWSLRNNSNVTLQALLRAGNEKLRVNAIQASFTKRALAQYTQSSDGSCAALLGSQCVQEIQRAALENDKVEDGKIGNCSDAVRNATDFSFVIDPFRSTLFNESGTYSGDPFFYFSSPEYTAGNQTLYDQAVSAVNVLVLNFQPNTTSLQGHGNVEPTVVCQVVDKSKAVSGGAPGLGGGVVSWALLATGVASFMFMA